MTAPDGTRRVVKALAIGAGGAGGQPISGDCVLHGWGLMESSGSAPARIDFYNGNSVGSQLIAQVTLTAGQSVRDSLGTDGITCDVGIFVNVVTGAVTGSVYVEDI